MLKRLSLAFAGLFALVTSAMGAGTIPFSLSQQLDSYGKPLTGGLLYLIQAGTTSTPQNCYQDSGLTIALPNPITLDAAGRTPQIFCADGTIKVRLTDKNGVTQIVADGIQVVGASSGSGGGGSVDATTILATGDMKVRYGTGTLSGFVRANGRTIGSSTSGASERANADTQALFEYLWGADANLTVSGGRGASANADWTANKTITLPDWRGRVIAGLDDMGNTAAGLLTTGYFNAVSGGTVLGAAGGAESQTLTIAQMPNHNHTLHDPGHNHTYATWSTFATTAGSAGGITTLGNSILRDTSSVTTGITIDAVGGGAAHTIVQPTRLATIYIKL